MRLFFLVEEAYTQQGRARIRRLHPDWAARPALMSRVMRFFFGGLALVFPPPPPPLPPPPLPPARARARP
jgi:hypothetical protein